MVQGGIFLRKMPLGIEDSVKTRTETAVIINMGCKFIDGLFDSRHLRGLDLFALNRRVFVFAGEEFGLLPGFGLRRDTEPALATGKDSVEPLGATATAIGGIVFLRAVGMATRIDGKYDAS
jgi:hypothetical protein